MSAWRIVGHGEAIALLRHSLAADRVSHAYLVTGPRGSGRRTLALELAKALNCLVDDVAARPCGVCRQCRLIDRGVHPDVRVVQRAPERKVILMRDPTPAGPPRPYRDNVAWIQSDAQLRPVDGRKKVYLVVNAEDLSEDAANRLLKTIEEPTRFVHFILTASDRGAVLPTVLSRCQEVRLRPVPREEIARALEDADGVLVARAAQIAALSGGSPGWALAAGRDAAVLERRSDEVRALHEALGAGRLDRLVRARALAERWPSQPDRLRSLLRTWLAWWRDVILTQLSLETRVVHIDPAERSAVQAAARHVSLAAARAAQRTVRRTLEDLEANVNARLALDLLLLQLPRADVVGHQ